MSINITYRKLTRVTDEELELFNKWDNDPELVPYIRYSPDREAFEKKRVFTHADIEKRLKKLHLYMVCLDEKPVGFFDFTIDPDMLHRKVPRTGWPAVVIGEKSARGKGIGVKVLDFLEIEMKKLGVKRVELGVFEYNERAIRLYEKCGYREFARIPDFTYYDGKMYADIRMEKYF